MTDEELLAALNRPKASTTPSDDDLMKALSQPKHERAWDRAVKAAAADGVNLVASSHIRDTAKQQELYDKRQRGENKYPVAKPGTSEHEAQNGGTAWDVKDAEGRAWLDAHPEHGLVGNTVKDDPVHYVYREPAKAVPKAAPAATPSKSAIADAPKNETSAATALGLGAAQGATFGFGDEIQGTVQSLGNLISGYHADEGDSAPSLLQDYRMERDAARAENDKAGKDHSIIYGVGQVGGGLGTAALPVGGAVKGLKGAAVAGAGLGAWLGLGHSKAELTSEEPGKAPGDAEAVGDMLKSGAAGAALAPVGLVAGKVAGAVGRRVADAGRGFKTLFGGIPGTSLDRAAETLGAEVGTPSKDIVLQDALESGAVDRLPPSAFTESASKAPTAIANIASRPEIKVAEEVSKQGLRQGLKSTKAAAKALVKPDEATSELRDAASGGADWATKHLAEKEATTASHAASEASMQSDIKLLEDMAARRLPSANGLNALMTGLAGKLGPVGRALQNSAAGNSANLARVLSDPAKSRELAMLLHAGRAPNLAKDAAEALAARAAAIVATPTD